MRGSGAGLSGTGLLFTASLPSSLRIGYNKGKLLTQFRRQSPIVLYIYELINQLITKDREGQGTTPLYTAEPGHNL